MDDKTLIKILMLQRDVAITHLARWCVAIEKNGSGWDDWDEFYKDAAWRKNALPAIRELLDKAIEKARQKIEFETSDSGGD